MYNKYMQSDMEAFSDLYRRVECENKPCDVEKKENNNSSQGGMFSLGKLLGNLDIEKIGLLPLVLLLLLLVDVEDDEKLIIIILAIVFGI
ncbi:MAG: hypothetical protein IKU65_04500 [Oscillospiraceae bacterium]|nr:hypothetical protein [Oscillospiraceae bacterium]